MPVVLCKRPSAEETCQRLEAAAGVDRPVLDRARADVLLDDAMRIERSLFARRVDAMAPPHLRKKKDRLLRQEEEKLRKIDAALDALEEALCEYVRPTTPPKGWIASEKDLQCRRDTLAEMKGHKSRILLYLFDAVLLRHRLGRLAPPRRRIPRRRGRTPDPTATAVAAALVPLWAQLSDQRGVWKDAITGKWRGPLLDVAEWFTATYIVIGPRPDRHTLARALLRQHPEFRG